MGILYGAKHGRFPVREMDIAVHGSDAGARAHWRRGDKIVGGMFRSTNGEKPCLACAEAHRRDKQDRQRRAREQGLAPDDPRHGAYGYRTYGCRCEVCLRDGRAQQREWYRSERSGHGKA